jgi:hypothetical protein
MPKTSGSPGEYMEVDLGRLEVRNSIAWEEGQQRTLLDSLQVGRPGEGRARARPGQGQGPGKGKGRARAAAAAAAAAACWMGAACRWQVHAGGGQRPDSPPPPPGVRPQVRLSKVSGVVGMGGRRRNNIIREMGDGVRVAVVRALASDAAALPALQVSARQHGPAAVCCARAPWPWARAQLSHTPSRALLVPDVRRKGRKPLPHGPPRPLRPSLCRWPWLCRS